MNLVTDPDLVCAECDQPLPAGSAYSERLLGVCDDKPVVDEVCVPCATKGALT